MSPVADDDLTTLIPWLLEEAVQAANSDAPVAAGKLTLAAQLLGERLERDEDRAALSAPQQGAPSDEDLTRTYQNAYEPAWQRGEVFGCHIDGLRAVLTRYAPQVGPVAPGSICTGCNTPRHEAIAAIANGAMACCPDCSTLTVDDRNTIRAIKAVPVPVAERLPDPGDLCPLGMCWWYDSKDGTWVYCDQTYAQHRGWRYWLPHWALPLPEAQP